MNRIAYPLKPDMQGTMVANLQDALQQCLDRGILPLGDNDEPTRRKWLAALKSDRTGENYGDATAKLVSFFQEGRHLPASGEVDEPTASALNALLKEWGILDSTDRSRPYVVSGAVQREDGLLLGRVHAVRFTRLRVAPSAWAKTQRMPRAATPIRYDLLPGADAINLSVSRWMTMARRWDRPRP